MTNIFWLQVLISKRMIQDHMPDNVLDALEKVLLIIWKWGKIIYQRRNITHIREGVNGKKRFLSGIARIRGGGVYPCPKFLALFLEVHILSIKRVYFFKNANVLNFNCFLGC